MKGRRYKVRAAVLALMAAGAVSTAVFLNSGYRGNEKASNALVSGDGVEVYEPRAGMTVFDPGESRVGLIFYPGGLVEDIAYGPLLRGLAEEGVFCALMEMPLDLAVFGADKARQATGQFEEIERWYLCGHSLGGAMAASHAAESPGEYEGLILLAAYSTQPLPEEGLRVASIYGSEDGVLNMEKYRQYASNLPDGTVEQVIEGGCHAYFGSYGPQRGDGTAALSWEEQTAVSVDLIVDFICEN